MSDDKVVQFKQLVLEKVRLRWGMKVRVEFVDDFAGGPAGFADLVVDEVSMAFERQLAAKHEWSNESGWQIVPLTWWDHWKLDVLPRLPLGWRMLERFPARMRTILVEVHNYRVCPHIGIPTKSNCVKWLEGLDG